MDQLCRRCGQSVTQGRLGSFTQWIFRSKSCRCTKPLLAGTAPSNSSQTESPIGAPVSGELEDSFYGRLFTSRYAVTEELDEESFVARDIVLEKMVTVRWFPSRYATAEKMINFQDACRRISRVQHPSIVSLIDFGVSDDNEPFIVTEGARGASEKFIAECGELPLDVMLLIVLQVCDALTYAHARGITHGSLSADNVSIYESNSRHEKVMRIRICEFGLSHLTSALQSREDETNASEEQLVDRINYDIYCVAALLFEMLTGKRVPEQGIAGDSLVAHFRPDLELPEGLQQFLDKALLDDGLPRPFASVEAFKTELIENCESPQVTDTIWMLAEQANHFNRQSVAHDRRKWLVSGVALVFLGMGIVVIAAHQLDAGSGEKTKEARTLKTLVDPSYSENLDPSQEESARKLRQKMQEQYLEQFVSEGSPEMGVTSLVLSDKVMRIINSGKHLQSIRFQQCEETSSKGLEKIRNLPRLAEMHFEYCDVDDECMRTLATFPHLKQLIIIQAEITDRGLESISKSPSIESLTINSCDITNSGISYLCNSKVRELSLVKMPQVNDDTISVLLQWQKPGLQTLLLCRTNVTDKGIERLVKMRSLTSLSIDQPLVATENCVQSIARMPNLQNLNLGLNTISERSIQVLSKLPKLQYLALTNSPLNLDLLKKLRHFKSLRMLQLVDCTVSPNDAQELRRVLPNCAVVLRTERMID